MAIKDTKGVVAHHSHRRFNKRFDAENCIPASNIVESSWVSNKVLEELPTVANDFARARDPFIAKQMDDLGKSETERREEETHRQSRMVSKDRPQYNLKPPKQFATPSDARKFSRAWLREQRDAAMDQVGKYEEAIKQLENPEPQRHRGREPDR